METKDFRGVGKIITPIVDYIDTKIKDVFLKIDEYISTLRRCHRNLYQYYDVLSGGSSQESSMANGTDALETDANLEDGNERHDDVNPENDSQTVLTGCSGRKPMVSTKLIFKTD